MHQKPQSYNVQFLRYGVRQTECFVILGHFLPADKNESFQQVDSNIFAVCSWECPKFQNTKFANRCKISNKDEVDFLAGDKH